MHKTWYFTNGVQWGYVEALDKNDAIEEAKDVLKAEGAPFDTISVERRKDLDAQ